MPRTETPGERTSRFGKRVRAAAAILVAVLLAWGLRLATVWGDRTAVVVTFLAFLAGPILLLDWLFVEYGPGAWRFVRSLSASLWSATRADEEVRALVARHPRIFGWLGRRVGRDRAAGLYLTVTVALTALFGWYFVSIAASLVFSRAITDYDPQISALIRAFRTPGMTRVLWIATVLADPRVIVLLAVAVAALFVVWGRRSEALLLAVVLGGGTLAQMLMKLAFARPRPPAASALIAEPSSSSFPSAHAFASMLFAGVVVFVVWRAMGGVRQRLAVVVIAGAVVALVGVSRIYLGVHWMSDVVGSWCLALAWLSATCGGYLMLVRYRGLRERWPAWSTRGVRVGVTALVAVGALAGVSAGAQADPLLARATAAPPETAWRVRVDATGTVLPTSADLKQVPTFSEKLDGSSQEPVSIIFVGTQEQLVDAFKAAGWDIADKPSVSTLGRAVVAAIQNRAYPTAPVTPTFLGGSVQDLAFEKPSGTATVRRRHHARFWKTRLSVGEAPVWVATASFDSRLEIGSAIPLPTHHIDANIDAEQAFVVRDLVGTGRVEDRGRLKQTDPMAGTDAQGDAWFTQGYATVLQAVR